MLKHFFTAAAAAGAARLSDGTHDFVTGAQPKREATEGFKHDYKIIEVEFLTYKFRYILFT